MSSPNATQPSKAKPIYVSQLRGEVKIPIHKHHSIAHGVVLEAKARDTATKHTHYARGGENEWAHRVEDGVIEQALQSDHNRLKELGWVNRDHPIRSLRGGPAIPTKSSKPKKQPFRSLWRRSFSGSGSPPSASTTGPPNSRLYEPSLVRSEETQSIAFSDFTAPSFLPDELDTYSDGYESENADAANIQESRIRSFSWSSTVSEDNSMIPETPTVAPREYDSPSTSGLVFKHHEAPLRDDRTTEQIS
ncbi:hypothetical protein FRC17_006481 [Serendipita sp. 399]|nr:hypothetical protein FRC17_006481 [Serendipita sp. 399]